ncbi:type VI secretion system tube protein Hcp [Yersinia enterocolitica]|uniref:type VI secretion system tube protein Hcp n=1 Tax=Yersinia enterocolitica TaxID=630 RepID=UPI003D06137A
MAEVQTLFVKFDGIKGTSTVQGYTDYIAIDSMHFSTLLGLQANATETLVSTGISLSTISFTKVDDYYSDERLNLNMTNNTPYKEVTFVKVTTHAGKAVENKKIIFSDVYVTSAETSLMNDSAAVNYYILAATQIQRESYAVNVNGNAEKVGPSTFNTVTGRVS